MSKDFTSTFNNLIGIDNTNKNTQQKYGVQEEQKVQSVKEAQAEQHTQGRKGYKMQRINMAFTPDNIDFLRTISKVKGQTMTQFVNDILDKAREENKDLIEQIKSLNI